jgi:hypothetical protein
MKNNLKKGIFFATASLEADCDVSHSYRKKPRWESAPFG